MAERKVTDEEIEAYCEARGFKFQPWEWPRPWKIADGEECPYPPHTAGAKSWPRMQSLRRKIIADLQAA